MRLTHFTDYALRVLIYLGAHGRAGRLSTIGDIATAYGISENHLMKVVHHLARQGYVETIRGKGGGLRLARAPEAINIGEVVRGAEDDFALVECFKQGNSRCPVERACLLSGMLLRARDAFFDALNGQTLADVLKPRQAIIRLLRGARKPETAEPKAGSA